MSEIILTDQNFSEKVIKNQKPILVDFWAEWCMPCSMISPILEKLAEEYGDKFVLAKANVDQTQDIAQKYEIEAIPTVIFFRNGKPIGRFIGVKPESEIKGWIDEILSNNK